MPIRTAAIVLSGCMLATVGCAERKMITVRTLESRSWIGRTENELVKAWGEPVGQEIDGEGRRVLVYDGSTRERIYFPAPEHRVPDGSVPAGFVEIDAGAASRTPHTWGVIARFHIDDDGIVREYWMHPALKRMPLPPPRGRCNSTSR